MTVDPTLSRRALLAGGVALSTAMAGCSGGENSSGTPARTETGTEAAEGTPESTGTPTDPAPSLSAFDYPDGASREGIDSTALYSTHESTVTGAGSLTLDRERVLDDQYGGFTRRETNEFGSAGIYREIVESDTTEAVWSPSGEDRAYTELSSGFDTVYRIDNQAPDTNEVTGLFQTRLVLEDATWGEATDVVAAGDEFAVRYEATGLENNRRVAYGNTAESFTATIAVTASGYVRELGYSVSYTQDGETVSVDVTATLSSVGSTTVEAPSWRDTAAENGVQFTGSLTDAGTAYRLEMVNGSGISSDARLSLRDDRGRDDSSLPNALTVGDTLYVGLSQSNELLVGSDGTPDGARELRGSVNVDLSGGPFTLFTDEQSAR